MENDPFNNPDFTDEDCPMVDEIIQREIRPTHSIVQPDPDHWRETRKLFGNDFWREYSGREIADKFQKQRLKSKRTKRLP